ncbi:MAG: anaerobic ribonucleoside-triphosphate reductase activating protein [Erysipelotrichaceae bacterium]|nr:anaerobic ribonucleoside-triphosphate reductase activating protein [Erysipelotrichaceae bacterium]
MEKTLRLARELQTDSIVDGIGLRTVLWLQGCTHDCLGCHNPSTHAVDGGIEVALSDVIHEIKGCRYQSGLTLSGGEPFLQASSLVEVVKEVRSSSFNIWAYSGFTFEELLAKEEYKQLLSYIDILVDGRFCIEQKDERLQYKGSKNQRIIDVQRSIQEGYVVISCYDDVNNAL